MSEDRKHRIKDHLNHTREELLELVGQLTPVDWERQVQAEDGHWTLQQMMLHVAISEAGQIKTATAIIAGQSNVPDDFDLDRYNRRQIEKNAAKLPPEILFGMAESRQKLLALIDEVSEADLDKRGKHGRGDVLTLEQLFYRIGEHEEEHAATMKAALGK